MKVQDWIFSVRHSQDIAQGRCAIVGPASSATVEAALRLAKVPESTCAEIRACPVVRDFVEGRLDPDKSGYYAHGGDMSTWCVCIGSVQEVLPR